MNTYGDGRRFGVISKDSILLMAILFYIFYTFWFQYSFFAISGLISVLGIAILLLSIFEIRGINDYFLMGPLVLFVLFLLILSIFYSGSMEYAVMIIEYLIPCFGVFSYARKSELHFERITKCIIFATALLSIALITKGVETYDGAIRLNDLNSNQASNLLSFGLTLDLFLIKFDKKISKNLLYVVIAIFLCIAQIMTASRRGFVIMAFLIFAYILAILSTVYRRNYLLKILIILGCLSVGVYIILNYASALQSVAIFQRLSGENTTGDIARIRYQKVAIELFKGNPIFGQGLGEVARVAGAYSHSLYFELLACTGLVGFCTIILYFINMAKKVNSIRMKRLDNTQICGEFKSLYMIVFIVSILISGIAVVFIYESYFYIMIAVIISYIAICQKQLYHKRTDEC